MTKRYENFEEWMVGERVHWDGGFEQTPDSGVVIGMYRNQADTVYVKWDSDWGKAWLNVDKVTFEKDSKVEEQNTEQEIKWEVGQVVWDTSYGRGDVFAVFQETEHTVGQLQVVFDSSPGFKVWYNLDGSYQLGVVKSGRTLFFSEPKIEAELFPPKKPFVPVLKEGDVVFVKHKNLYKESYTLEVSYEDEDAVWFKNENDGFLKTAWKFFKIGEEIKWES